MKIGACYVLFNEEDYIRESLSSIYEFANRIFILLGEPFNGSKRAKDKTEEYVLNFPDPEKKIDIYYSTETDESKNKNFQLDLCRQAEMDWMWIVDGDEVYNKENFKSFLDNINNYKEQLKNIDMIRGWAREYWRSIHYTPGITEHNILFSTKSNVNIRIRMMDKDAIIITTKSNLILFNHYGLARTPEKMKEKYTITDNRLKKEDKSTYSIDNWLINKFLPWRPNNQIENIHPFYPKTWSKVEKVNDKEIPEIMLKHKWYGVEVIE